jgi:tetratricopeptide (TPR) repeat protein
MNLGRLDIDDDQRRLLEELFKDNAELREQLRPAEDSPHERAFRIVSIVRTFDQPMYEGVCRKQDLALPAFDEIVKDPDVQRVPRADGKFWLREVAQNHWLSYWDGHAGEYAKWAELFVAWLGRNDKDSAEQLALLLRFDSPRALELLTTTFEKANAADDLILCHSLAQQVEANMERIDPALRSDFSRFTARYRGRAWFLREFHRTTRYFPRAALEADFWKLINGDGSRWILYLSAAGGMGKTMFVQRMIAHELLKQPPFPLVARIDLDDIEVSELAKWPWLAAIEIAEELDQQLTWRLFSSKDSSFHSSVRMFGPLLYRRDSDRGRILADDERAKLRALASDQSAFWSSFIGRCSELPRDRPLVVFIDTIEEATLHWPAEFRNLLARFEELRGVLPQLRLIVSGRYPPFDKKGQPDQPDMGQPDQPPHFHQYDEKLKGQTNFVQLEPLVPPDDEKFIRYQLPNVGSRLMQTMISAAAGNPFKLTMLCEIVGQDLEMTAEKLEDYGPDVDVAYLIKRVVERLPVADELGLRWLLRYGAIPRRLTLSFVQEVLRPVLIDALSGKIEEAGQDVPSPKEREAWLKNANVALDPAHLWEQLSKYASSHGWISLQSKDPHTATLHPDVVKPMRRLIRQQPIFHRIHREALSHLARLKQQQPDRWVELTLADLYHRVELGEEHIEEKLVKALDERPAPDAVALRKETLREIVKPGGDFANAPAATLARAHYEVADAIAVETNFDYLPQGGRRGDIRRSLEKAFELNRQTEVALPPFAFRWRDFLDRNIPGTWSAVAALLLDMKGDGRTRYWLLITEMLAQRKFPSLLFEVLAGFLGMSDGRLVSDRIPGWVVLERAAAAYTRRGEHRKAERYLREILDNWKGKREEGDFERIQTSLIVLLASTGNLRGAEEEIQKADAAADERNQDRLLIRIEICLLRRDAWAALALTEKMKNKKDCNYHRLRGRALGQLLRINDAIDAFSEATKAGRQANTLTILDDIGRDELTFRVFEAGLPNGPASPPPSLAGAALELELIRAFQLRGDPTVCEGILQTLISPRNPEAIRIRATLAGVSWGVLPPAAIDDSFVTLLRRLGNAGSRLWLLEAPALSGRAAPWRLGRFKRWELRTELQPGSRTGSGMMEWVHYGRVLLAMGDRARADKAFANVSIGMDARKETLAVFRQRCLGDPEAPAQSVAFWSELASEPGLYMAALTENAERAMHHSEWVIARESLAQVATLLQTNSVHSVFAERHRALQAKLAAREEANNPAPAPTPSASAGHTAKDGDATLADYRCALLAVETERISVEVAGQDRRLLSVYENESLRILCNYARELAPTRLVPHFVQNWPEPVEELREPLANLLQRPGDAGETLLLALAGTRLVAVPWELAVPRSQLPVRIGNGRQQGPVADEIRRPAGMREAAKFVSGLSRQPLFRSKPGIGVYRVPYSPSSRMIAQMSVLDDRLLASHLYAGPDLASAEVIYIMTDIEDSPSLREPCLPDGMTGERLGSEIQRSRRAGSRPFVVLHAPRPESLSNALEQVFARNRLAQALVNSGAVSGVLATGITSSASDPRRQDLLLESLRRATQVFDVMRTLRASSDFPVAVAGLDEMLGLPATALFLNTDPGPLLS